MTEEKTADSKPSKWDHLADDYHYWMKRTLDDILTEYVRSKVKGPYHENIHYIHDLMSIEMYALGEPDILPRGCHMDYCATNTQKSTAQFSLSCDQI